MSRISNRGFLTAIGAILAFGIGYQMGNMINASMTFAQTVKKMNESTNRATASQD